MTYNPIRVYDLSSLDSDRIERHKQGIDDEDISDVYLEPENLQDREDYYFFSIDRQEWFEVLNFRPQRDYAGTLHHWSAKCKQITNTPQIIEESSSSASSSSSFSSSSRII